MGVFYVDVFFLINFTIDLISIFTAARILHIRTSIIRLIVISVFGSIVSLVDVFSGSFIVTSISSLIYFILLMFIIEKSISFSRRVKLLALFIGIEIVLAGIVYMGYGILDKIFENMVDYIPESNENRSALIFSLLVLLAIGLLRLFVIAFSSAGSLKSSRIKIEFEGINVELDALVDSGNLVKDPLTLAPVVFVKSGALMGFMPDVLFDLDEFDASNIESKIKRIIRMIPVLRGDEKKIMIGFVPDRIMIYKNEQYHITSATVVIDKNEGDFGGYKALIPSCITDHV